MDSVVPTLLAGIVAKVYIKPFNQKNDVVAIHKNTFKRIDECLPSPRLSSPSVAFYFVKSDNSMVQITKICVCYRFAAFAIVFASFC